MSIVGHEFKWINKVDTIVSPRVDKIYEKYRFLEIQQRSNNHKQILSTSVDSVDRGVGDDTTIDTPKTPKRPKFLP